MQKRRFCAGHTGFYDAQKLLMQPDDHLQHFHAFRANALLDFEQYQKVLHHM
jgi:hypothetical protein